MCGCGVGERTTCRSINLENNLETSRFDAAMQGPLACHQRARFVSFKVFIPIGLIQSSEYSTFQ